MDIKKNNKKQIIKKSVPLLEYILIQQIMGSRKENVIPGLDNTVASEDASNRR